VVLGSPARGCGDRGAGVVALVESCRAGFGLTVARGDCSSEMADVSGIVVAWSAPGRDDSAEAGVVSSVFSSAGAVVSAFLRLVLSRMVAVDPG
jgi:hypothetical protein